MLDSKTIVSSVRVRPARSVLFIAYSLMICSLEYASPFVICSGVHGDMQENSIGRALKYTVDDQRWLPGLDSLYIRVRLVVSTQAEESRIEQLTLFSIRMLGGN